MNYLKITTPDIENGLGFRVTLWCSGCKLNCPGCHNPETHSFTAGKPFTEETMEKLLNELGKSYISGLTLSGGNPLDSDINELLAIVKRVKEVYPKKNIWLYSGYTLEQIQGTEKEKILPYVDVIVDSPFILKEKDLSIAFRGSRNQRILEKIDNEWVLKKIN